MNDKYLEEKLNSENIEYVASLLEEINTGSKITYEEDDKGNFIILKDGRPLYEISKEYKVGEVLGAISQTISKNEDNINPKEHKSKTNGNTPKIFVSLNKLNAAVGSYQKALGKIGETSSLLKADYISGELRREYNKLNDNTAFLISALSSYIGNLSSVINYSIACYSETDLKNMKDLKELVDSLFGEIDNVDEMIQKEIHNSSLVNEDESVKISLEEFNELFNMTDELYRGPYEEVLNDFRQKLQFQYLSFKRDVEPEILNGVIESLYFSGSNNKNQSDKNYIEGLKTFKSKFTDMVFSQYNHSDEDIMNSAIPLYLWNDENKSDYDKAILLTVYNNFDGIYESGVLSSGLYKFAEEYKDDNYRFKSREALSIVGELGELITLENSFNKALDFNSGNAKDDIKNVINDYQKMMEDILIRFDQKEKELFTSYQFDEEELKVLKDTLVKYNYIQADEEIGAYSEIFTKIYHQDGSIALQKIFNAIDENINIAETTGKNSFLSDIIKHDIYNGFISKYKLVIDDLVTKKCNLDLSKNNFQMSLASSLDTSSVTDEELNRIKSKLGNKAKYLEEWQLKTLALANQEGYDNLYSVYENQISSGIGYENAIKQITTMTGGTNHNIRNTIVGSGYSILGGFYDGILNSIKGVARVVTADGKMNEDDYRQVYLQELLNTDFSLYTDYYDKTRENHDNVIKMLGNNYDLSLLSNYKDNKGNNLFDEEYYYKAKESNLSLYEILYSKGVIDDVEYQKYALLNQRKDDGNIALYSDMGANYGYKEAAKWGYNISSSVGNMAISMALAGVNPILGQIWMGLSVTGNEREQMLLSGKDNNAETFLHAACKGALAVGTEKFLGALHGLGDKADDVLGIFKSPKLTNFVTTKFGQVFAKTLSNQVNETIEELAENAGNYVLDYIFDRNIPTGSEMLAETWQTVYMTFLTTPLINLMGSTMHGVNQRQTHDFNGFKANYSQSEIDFFVNDNGVLNTLQFMEFLRKNNRIVDNSVINASRGTNNINNTESSTLNTETPIVSENEIVERTFDKIKVRFSQAELKSFVSNGKLSAVKFYNYLLENGRIDASVQSFDFVSAISNYSDGEGSYNTGGVIELNNISNLEQAAFDFSEGDRDLERLLLECWREHDLETYACCRGDHGSPYIYFRLNNLETLNKIITSPTMMDYNFTFLPDGLNISDDKHPGINSSNIFNDIEAVLNNEESGESRDISTISKILEAVKSSPQLKNVDFTIQYDPTAGEYIIKSIHDDTDDILHRAVGLSGVQTGLGGIWINDKNVDGYVRGIKTLSTKIEIEDLSKKLSSLAEAKGMSLKDLGSQRSSETDPIRQKTADDYASDLFERASSFEKVITDRMHALEDQNLSGISFEELQERRKNGSISEYSVLAGLDYKLKSKDSMSRKILFDANRTGISLEQARDRIGDSLRYTLLIDDENYANKTKQYIDSLRKDGYNVVSRNSWGTPMYQGVNTSIISPDGMKFELQFHTIDSYYTKENLTHAYYEVARNEFTTIEEKNLAKEIQRKYQSILSRPKDIVGYNFDGGKNE